MLGREENTSGFAHIFGSGLTPLDVLGVLLGENHDLLAIDHEVLAVLFDLTLEGTVHTVVFEVVDHVVQIHEGLVHCHDVGSAGLDGSAGHQTSDTTETVDTEVEFCALHDEGMFFRIFF